MSVSFMENPPGVQLIHEIYFHESNAHLEDSPKVDFHVDEHIGQRRLVTQYKKYSVVETAELEIDSTCFSVS